MAQIALRKYTIEISELIEHGQLEEGIAHCRHILKTYPRHVETYRMLGKAYLEAQRYSDATDILQRVLSSVPDDFIAHIGMSIIREDEGNIESAVWHMERAFEVNPSNQAIQGELRRLYGKRDGAPPAKIRLTRGALARMYAHGDLYQQSIDELLAALSEDPQRPDLDVLLAEMYYLAEKNADSADAATKLVSKLPNCKDGNRLLAILLTKAERPEEQIAPFRDRWHSLDPYAAALNELTDDPDMLRDDAVLVDHLDYDGVGGELGAESDKPQWAASLGVNLETGAESDAWLGDFGITEGASGSLFDEDESGESGLSDLFTDDLDPETIENQKESDPLSWMTEERSAESSAFDDIEPDFAASRTEDDSDDWLGAAADASTAGAAATSLFDGDAEDPGFHQAETEFFNEPEDVKDMIDATRPNPATSDEDEEDMSWLQDLTGEVQSEMGAPAEESEEDDGMDWLEDLSSQAREEASEETMGEDAPVGAGAWDIGTQPQTTEEPAAEMPALGSLDADDDQEDMDWLQNLGGDLDEPTAPDLAASTEDDDDEMDWLEDLTSEVQDEMGDALPAAPAEASDVTDDDMDWLNTLDEKTGVPPSVEPTEEEIPEFLKEAGWEEGVGEETPTSMFDDEQLESAGSADVAAGDVPDWVKEMAPSEEEVAAKDAERAEMLKDQPTEWLEEVGEETAGDVPDWIDDLAVEPAAAAQPLAQEDADDEDMDWLDDLTAEVQQEVGAVAETGDNDEMPEIGEDIMMERLSDTGSIATDDDEDMAWLDDLTAEVREEAGAASGETESMDELAWLTELESDTPTAGTEKLNTGELQWLDEVVGEHIGDEPDREAEDQPVESASAEPASEDEEDMAWLEDLTGEVQSEMADQPTAATEESVEDLSWLEDMASESSAEDTVIRSRLPEDPAPVVEDLSWLDEIEAQTHAKAGEASETGKNETGWLEGLTTNEDTPEEHIELDGDLPPGKTVPEWLQSLDTAPAEGDAAAEPPEWLPDVPGEPKATRPNEWVPEKIAAEQPQKTGSQAAGKKSSQPPSALLEDAAAALAAGDVERAVKIYARVIQTGKGLDDVISGIREALRRHPVDVTLWEKLGDAYMKHGLLQEAMDSYTKAEDLVR